MLLSQFANWFFGFIFQQNSNKTELKLSNTILDCLGSNNEKKEISRKKLKTL